MVKLNVSDVAPDFELSDHNGEIVKLSNYRGKKLLLYFFPKADTPGCTLQTCSVNLSLSLLKSSGMLAVGISPDECEDLKDFAEKYSVRFPLLSDPNHEIAAKYGVWGIKHKDNGDYEGIIRSSFVIDESGHVAQINYNVSPTETVTRAEQLLLMY